MRSVLTVEEIIASRAKPANWLRNVLDYNPYDGDFGDSSDRVLVNEVRIARRAGRCLTCEGPIEPGALARTLKGCDDDGFYGGRHCEDCCDAMALDSAVNCGDIEDDDEAFDALSAMDRRHALRRERDVARA